MWPSCQCGSILALRNGLNGMQVQVPKEPQKSGCFSPQIQSFPTMIEGCHFCFDGILFSADSSVTNFK